MRRAVLVLAAATVVMAAVFAAAQRESTISPDGVESARPLGGGPTLPRVVARDATAILPEQDAPASDLLDYAQGLFGRRFAGMWVKQVPPFGFVVGVVRPTASDSIRIQRAFSSIGTRGEIASVTYPETKLRRVAQYIADRIGAANVDSAIQLSVGLRPDLNAVELLVPAAESATVRQRRLVSRAVRDFGGMIRLGEAQSAGFGQEKVLPCRDVFCDPPLRSGIWTFTDFVGCTGGFLARSRSDGRLYQLSAGHCRVVWDQTWLTRFASGQVHMIGPVHNSVFGRAGDASIAHVSNPPGWRSRAWVSVRGSSGVVPNESYSIVADATPVVGARVCASGAASRSTRCGVVTTTDVTATYDFLGRLTTVSGLVRASFCAVAGDSGSPVFANHVAYGIVSGGSSSGTGLCSTLFEPVRAAEDLLRVNVSHDSG